MAESKKIYLKDYQAPNYFITNVNLQFDIFEEKTIVTQKSKVKRNEAVGPNSELRLNGENLKLIELTINGEKCDYSIGNELLTIASLPEEFDLKIITEIEPHNNKALEGLYKSGDIFCTQCEAEGFRHITYFIDRPDNMAIYTTTITADKTKYPVLLSNGNKTESKDLEDGRHLVTWNDPHKKPCYLFALVAGDLEVLTDSFTTMSGKNVALEIYVEKGRKERTHFAMESLINSMKWDEQRYGLEYDLDIYMIVAVDAFNMGAMENKGLNVFNSKYVLANQETATDKDYENIEAVIGHEYFHNWTGNRVTCRDWFQLSLKEGLTVYRDQEFTSDLRSRGVKRLQDVAGLRARQFVEDAGPNAHPVRPKYAASMDNLYTSTIYSKGAEVIRMIEKLVGRDGFRKGMDLYFKMYDGQAVCTEDFVLAMEKANNVDLTHFKNWYDQAGTPTVTINTQFDEASKTYTINFKQHTPATPETENKKPFHIPFEMGLLNSNGESLSLKTKDADCKTTQCQNDGLIVELVNEEHNISFEGISEEPTPSFLREFSAPVKVNYSYTTEQLANLIENDKDSFNQWNAAQDYYRYSFKNIYTSFSEANEPKLDSKLFDLFKSLLNQSKKDAQFYSELLKLPPESYLQQFFTSFDPTLVSKSLKYLKEQIALACEKEFTDTYLANQQANFNKDGKSIGERALANLCLSYLTATKKETYFELAKAQYEKSFCMTNTLGSMEALNHTGSAQREEIFNHFYNKWKDDPNVINNWLRMESYANRPQPLQYFQDKILKSDAFDENIPNKIYSTLLVFSSLNTDAFHEASGDGYKFIADQILAVDSKNPQVASRLCSTFNMWKKWGDERGKIIQPLLKKIASHQGLSRNSSEIINNALK